MYRLLSVILIAFSFCLSQAQNVQRQYLDSLNNVVLLTSDYMTYCTQGFRQSKNDERHSVALNYYYNKPDSYYILSLPIVTEEQQDIKKGNLLKLVIQKGDTVTLKASTDFASAQDFQINDSTFWAVYPKYHLSEKTLRQLLDNDIQLIYQQLPDGKYLRLFADDFRRWNFTKTLKTIYRELNKQKIEDYDADLLYNNGRYKYITNDTVVSTDRHIKFSDKWMY